LECSQTCPNTEIADLNIPLALPFEVRSRGVEQTYSVAIMTV